MFNAKKEKVLYDAKKGKLLDKFKIDEIRKEWHDYYKEITFIEKIVNDRILWSKRMHELNRFLPLNMCINKLDVRYNNNNLAISVYALAKKNQEFASVKQFINSLEESPLFGSRAEFKYERTKLKERDVVLFNISVPLRKN